MANLLSIRQNIKYAKKPKKQQDDADEFIRIDELIFIVENPTYRYTNEGDIVRERKVDQFRIDVLNKDIDLIIKTLEGIRDSNESDLGL